MLAIVSGDGLSYRFQDGMQFFPAENLIRIPGTFKIFYQVVPLRLEQPWESQNQHPQ